MISFLRHIAGHRRAMLATAVLAVLLVLTPMTGATASTHEAVPAHGSAGVAADTSSAVGSMLPTKLDDDGSGNEKQENEDAADKVAESNLRTLNRWGDATNGFYTKFDGFVGTQLIELGQRSMIQGGGMGVGNFAMKTASTFTQFAVRLDFIDGMGAALDGIVNVMLKAIIGVTGAGTSGIIFGLIALITVLLALWRSARGGFARMVREVGAIVLILAIVFSVGSSAMKHDSNSANGYNPAVGTPGWLVKGVNDSLSSLASAPAATFVKGVEGPVWGSELDTSTAGGPLGCSAYTHELRAAFDKGMPSKTAAQKSTLAIASVMDSMWDSTGLYTWAKTQAGYKNPYAAKVYCRILDFRTGGNAASAATFTWDAVAASKKFPHNDSVRKAIITDASVRAPFAPSNAENTAASIVAWAACKATGFKDGHFTWAWEKDWKNFYGGHEKWGTAPRGWKLGDKKANDLCQKWWTAQTAVDDDKKSSGQAIPKEFFIKGDKGWLADRAKDAPASVQDFLMSFTGVTPWGGTAGVQAYVAGAFLTLIAFAIIDVIVIVSKMFLAMFILALWFVLIGAAFRPSHMKDRLAKTFNKFLGTAVFAGLTTVILTFVVVFSRSLIRIGIDIWGAGTVGSMIWSGLSPALALLLVHFMFTKVFKLPSPVSVRGAQAWGKSGMSGALGAGVGAGIGAGVGSFVGSRMGGMAKRAAAVAGKGALHKVSGGKLGAPVGARSAMSPAGTATKRADDLAARVDAGETLNRKDQKSYDRQVAKDKLADDQKAWGTAATEAAKQKAAAKTAKKEQLATDRADLRTARREYRSEHGVAAPGDLMGAAAVGVGGAARTAGAKVRGLGSQLAGRTGVTALRSELGSRKTARRDAVAQRKATAQERRTARQGITEAGATSVRNANANISGVFHSPAGAAKRSVWGAAGAAGATVAAGASVATAASQGAVASQAVSVMGGVGAGAALVGVAKSAQPSAEATVSGPGNLAEALADSSGKLTPGRVGPTVDSAPTATAGESAPSVAVGGAALPPAPEPERRDVKTDAGVAEPAAAEVKKVLPRPSAGLASALAEGLPVQKAAAPVSGTAPGPRGITPTVKRVADVLSAPADGVHGLREQAWKAQDAGRRKAAELYNSRKVVAARADAAIVRGALRDGIDSVRQSEIARDAGAAAKRTARMVSKAGQGVSAGAEVLATRKQNNAALLADFRSKRAAEAAQQGRASAAPMSGETNAATPTSSDKAEEGQ